MNSIIFITLALSVYNQTIQNDQKWIQYKEDFRKTYLDTSEEFKRYNIFKPKDEVIKAHNEKYMKGEVTYKMGHNHFSDMSDKELAEIYLSPRFLFMENSVQNLRLNFSYPKAPSSLSYKQYCLTPLSQGSCGSCWAFAATAQVEAQLSWKRGFKSYISPQYLLDCSGAGNCPQGGYSSKAIAFMQQNGGVLLNDYPYYGIQHQCNRSPKRIDLEIKNTYNSRINGNEEVLKNYLVNYGPVVLSMKVMNSFFSYQSGVYYDASCPNNCALTDHAVVVVGYGTDKYDYWLIKNSWGTGWGESGYVRMIRNWNNNCNIACNTEFAVV